MDDILKMLVLPSAKVILHNLHNADGSALYTSPNATHTLQSAVNYPLEVPYRSDEPPTETYIEVSLRPHNGVTMVRERHIESIVRKVLKSVILGEETPRCMLQATIQVMEVEADEELPGGTKGGGQSEGYLNLLVGAVNASILSCLDGGVQMSGLVGAVLVGVAGDGTISVSPSVKTRKSCASLHAFGFDSRGSCVLMDSQGSFDIGDLESAEQAAKSFVCGDATISNAVNGDVAMDDSRPNPQCLFELMRRSVEDRVARDERWKL